MVWRSFRGGRDIMSKLSNVYATGNALEIDHQIKQVTEL